VSAYLNIKHLNLNTFFSVNPITFSTITQSAITPYEISPSELTPKRVTKYENDLINLTKINRRVISLVDMAISPFSSLLRQIVSIIFKKIVVPNEFFIKYISF